MDYKKLENELDINFYISMNNDVAIRFNFDYNKIKHHFFNIGFKENRLYSKIHSNLYYYHDWNKYLSKNKDIISKKINNEHLAFKHYLDHGFREKREIFKKNNIRYDIVTVPVEGDVEIFDINFFRKINSQFSGLSDNEIIKYILKNKNNCLYTLNHRNLYENYDWNQYLIDYPDLKINKIFNKLDALLHYISFGRKEGRNLKIIDNDSENSNNKTNVNKKNNCINILEKIENPDYNDDLYEVFKNNILENTNNLDVVKYDIKDIKQINKVYEILCIDFDHNYYYKLNNKTHKLENNQEKCIEHFLKTGVSKYLPYSKNHYLLLINYDWKEFANKYSLTKNNDYQSFIYYIQHTYYFNKILNLPNIKYPIDNFINEFYNKLYKSDTNFLISYSNFLKIEDENKIYPNLFHYFLYQIINWDLFKKENNLDLDIYLLMNLLINNDYDFKKYKVEFNNVSSITIPDKNKLLDLSEFNNFYYKIINYTKNNKNIYNIVSVNNQFKKLFNKNLFDIPMNFKFINYKPYINKINPNLNFNIIVSYIGKFNSLSNLLLSIFYQNFNNYKIIILNKCNDSELEEKIKNLKNKLSIINDIIVINNSNINDSNFKNIIKIFDINLLIDTNFYFSNNNVFEYLNTYYEKNKFCFEKFIIEKKNHNNDELNSLLILNSNLLLNNLFLLFNYFDYKFDTKYCTNINNLILLNQHNFIDHNFYNSDIVINDLIIYTYPIFILYQNKDNLKYIKNLKFYNLFEYKNNLEFDNFIKYLNDNIIYDYVSIVFIDKILDNFGYININPIKTDNFYIINIYSKSKRKNVKKNAKTIPKLYSYEAILLNNFIRNNHFI